jgi:Carboxypeptidase regulatory-like domain
MANVEISAWVKRGNITAWDYPVKSDSTGHFRLENIPENVSVLLNPVAADDDHPCGSVSQSRGVVTIEMVPTDHPLLDAATTLPRITGVAYEVTLNGRQPVSGARIIFAADDDLTEATTTTDENGRYALCSLFGYYANQVLYAEKTGYQLLTQVVSASGSMQLDIELKH